MRNDLDLSASYKHAALPCQWHVIISILTQYGNAFDLFDVHQVQHVFPNLSERERNCTTSIQPAWLMRTDLCSCLGHLQNGCEAMANSLLVLMPHEQTHGAFSILKQIGILSPDGTKARAVKNVMKLIANSLSVAKVAPTEIAGEARPNKPALLNRQRM